MALTLSSSAFASGADIPRKHTCEGADVSPPLSWQPVAGAASFALIAEDPDAPAGTWVHWVIFNLPPAATQLAENIPRQAVLTDGSRQGRNDFKRLGYGGPCPPPGKPHRYFFRLYALDRMLDLAAGASKEELLRAMKGHILEQAELMGRYGREHRR